MLVLNTAGYTHAFDYKGKIIIIPNDGRVHVVPDDIPNFLELRRMDNPGVTKAVQNKPLTAPRSSVAASAQIMMPSVHNQAPVVVQSQSLLESEVISIELDDELKDVKIYDVFNEKYVKAKNLDSGYDAELNTMLANHLARGYVDDESAEISNEDTDMQDQIEAAAEHHMRKRKPLTLQETVEKRRAERERANAAKKKKNPPKDPNKPKGKPGRPANPNKVAIDPNAPKKKPGRPFKNPVAVIEEKIEMVDTFEQPISEE